MYTEDAADDRCHLEFHSSKFASNSRFLLLRRALGLQVLNRNAFLNKPYKVTGVFIIQLFANLYYTRFLYTRYKTYSAP